MIRFDSANFGGFNVQATVSGMEKDVDAAVYSVAASYTADSFSIHAGHYTQGSYDDKPVTTKDENLWLPGKKPGDSPIMNPNYGTEKTTTKHNYANAYSIFGGSMFLGDVTLTAAAKYMTQDTDKGENSQWAYSATAQYIAGGTWLYKVGAAVTSDAELNGVKKENSSDLAVTGRVGYLLPSAILYTDVRYRDMDGDNEVNKDGDPIDTTNIFLGVEYYF